MYDNYLKKVQSLNIIIYARLSKEEQNKSNEEQSKSIQNQIEICKEYIYDESKNYPDINYNILQILYDDGISGTTFNRKNFNQAIKLINDGKANMLITKDLSRFGREHIEADNYIERWFPENNIRYVAILDNVDTYMLESVSNDITPIKNWMNEMYAKNTSKAIKKTFKSKMKAGLWISGKPPIGYKIDPRNKGKLIVDKKGADIVKQIFKLALQNKNVKEIADICTKQGIPTPAILKYNKIYKNESLLSTWKPDTIRNILKNEIYLGHIIQGKTSTLNHKSNKIIYLDKKDWIKVYNQHEAIISKREFELVQSNFKTLKNKMKNSFDYLLKGLLICKECNHTIGIQHYSNRKKNYTICNFYRKYGNKNNCCTAHRFCYENLEKIIIKRIKNDCLKYIDKDKLCKEILTYQNNKNTEEVKNDIKNCKMEIDKLRKHIDIVYEDRLNGIIEIEEFKTLTENKKYLLNYELNRFKILSDQLKKEEKKSLNQNSCLSIINSYILNPNKKLINSLIDKIVITEEGFIEIYYKISNPLL